MSIQLTEAHEAGLAIRELNILYVVQVGPGLGNPCWILHFDGQIVQIFFKFQTTLCLQNFLINLTKEFPFPDVDYISGGSTR